MPEAVYNSISSQPPSRFLRAHSLVFRSSGDSILVVLSQLAALFVTFDKPQPAPADNQLAAGNQFFRRVRHFRIN